jgi:hypothetical protein
MAALMDEFHFDDDPCPLGGFDGLMKEWGKRVYMNPPYGRRIKEWFEKGILEMDSGRTELIVWLLPARTDTRWFHDLVLPKAREIRLLRGRLYFNDGGPAPFPSMIVVWKKEA